MTLTIVVANRKGGVGKTTTSVALADTFQAQFGLATVVVDTDPQGSASLALAGQQLMAAQLNEIALDTTLFTAALDAARISVNDFHWAQIGRLTDRPDIPLGLVPITPRYWRQERQARTTRRLWSRVDSLIARRFSRLMTELKTLYNIIVIDTPPGQSLLYDAAVAIADCIVVPCVPDQISIWGMDVLADEMRDQKLPSSKHVLWTRFVGNSNWQQNAEKAVEDHPEFSHFRIGEQLIGLPNLVNIPHAVTNIDVMRWSQAYPPQVQPALIRICEELQGTAI